MKKTLIILWFISCVLAGQAQTLSLESDYLSVTIANAVPTAEFGRNDYLNAKHGSAKSGAMIGLEYIKSLNKYIGLGGSIGHRFNPYDKNKVIDTYRDNGISLTEFSSATYRSTFFWASLLYKHHFNLKSNLYLKVNAGLAANTFPEQSYKLNGLAVNSAEATALAFASALGVGYRYNLGKMALGIELIQMHTTPEFERKNSSGSDSEKVKKPMNTSNVTLTIGYKY